MYSSVDIKGRVYKTKAILQSGTFRSVSTALPTLLSQRAPEQSLSGWDTFKKVYYIVKSDSHHMANFII